MTISTNEPSPIEMVEDLHRAVYGDTWARPETPQQVWEMLLDKVRGLASGWCGECERRAARETRSVLHKLAGIADDLASLDWRENVLTAEERVWMGSQTAPRCHECNGRGHTSEFSRDGYVTCDWCGGSGVKPRDEDPA